MFLVDLESFKNYILVAVDRIGGPTKAAHAVGVSNAAIHSWISKQRIPNIDKARLMAKLSGIDVVNLRPVL